MGLSRTFLALVQYSKESASKKSRLRKAVAMMQRGVLIRVFQGWSSRAKAQITERAEEARLEAKARQSFGKLMNRTLARSFESWHEWVEDAIRNRTIVSRFATRMKSRQIAMSFDSWRDFVDKRAYQRRLVGKVMGRCLNKQLFWGMTMWQKYTASHRDAEERAEREAEAKRHADEKSGMDGSIKALQSQVEELSAKLSEQTALAAGLQEQVRTMTWEREALECKFGAELRDLEEQRNKLKSDKAAQIILAWQNRSKSTAFEALRLYAETERRNRYILTKFTEKMKNARLESAFDGWKERAQTRAANRRLLERFAKQLKHRTASKAFQSWLSWKTEAKENRFKVNRFARRWRNMGLSRTFLALVQYSKESASKKARLRKAVAMMQRGVLIRVFQGWSSQAKSQITERAEEARLEAKARQSFGKLMNRTLARSFESWHEWVEDAIRNRTIVSRFATRMKSRQIAMSFDSWRDFVDKRTYQRRLVGKVMGRCLNKQLFWGMTMWQKYTASHRDAEERAEREAEAKRHADEKSGMDGSIKALQSQVEELSAKLSEQTALAAGLQEQVRTMTWEREALECKFGAELRDLEEQRNKLKSDKAAQIILAWQNRSKSTAFEALRSYAETERRNRYILTKFTEKMKNARLESAFDGWKERAQTRAANRRLLERFAKQLKHRTASKAFQSWLSWKTEAKENRFKVNRFARRWRNMGLSRTFLALVQYSKESASKKARLRKAVAMMQRGVLIRVFQGWSSRAKAQITERAEEARLEAKARQSFGKLMNRTLARSFESWHEWVEDAIRNRTIVSRFATRMKSRQIAMSFDSWRDFVDKRAYQRRLVGKVMGRCLNKQLFWGMTMWQKYTQMHREHERVQDLASRDGTIQSYVTREEEHERIIDELKRKLQGERTAKDDMKRWYMQRIDSLTGENARMRERTCAKMIKRWQLTHIAAPFNQWKNFADAQRALRVRMKRFALSWQNTRKARRFRQWNGILATQKAYRNKLTRFVKRYNGRAVAKCWNTWHTFHLEKVAEREAHEEQEARLKGFILKWKSDLKGSVFHKWHMAAVAEAKERAAAANALAIADMKKSMEAKLKAQEEKIKEDKMKRVLTRLRDSVVWSAFYTWKRHYIDEREAANRKRRMTAVSTKVQRIHDAYYTFSFAMYGIESKRQLFVALEKFARDAFNAIGGVLFMIDYDGDGSLWSFIEDGTREVRAPAGSGIAGSIVTQGKPISLPDARKHPQFSKIVDDAYTTAARSISFEDDDPDSIQALRLRAAPSLCTTLAFLFTTATVS